MKIMDNYHILYLKTDFLLLKHISEKLRKMYQVNYGLDPLVLD